MRGSVIASSLLVRPLSVSSVVGRERCRLLLIGLFKFGSLKKSPEAPLPNSIVFRSRHREQYGDSEAMPNEENDLVWPYSRNRITHSSRRLNAVPELPGNVGRSKTVAKATFLLTVDCDEVL